MSQDFNRVLFDSLRENRILSTKEIYNLFPDMNKQTVSWHLHRLLTREDITQVSHGCYELNVLHQADDFERLGKLPQFTQTAYSILSDMNCSFYLSGLDGLMGRGFSISGDYPVILCVESSKVKDVQLELMRRCDFAITEDEFDALDSDKLRNSIQFYILKTNAFELSHNHFACPEKAFVDLYYAITRLEYPIAVQTLPHVIAKLKPNTFKFKIATHDRGLSDELNFLTSYNKEFLREFTEILKG